MAPKMTKTRARKKPKTLMGAVRVLSYTIRAASDGKLTEEEAHGIVDRIADWVKGRISVVARSTK